MGKVGFFKFSYNQEICRICGETWVRYAPDGLFGLLKYVRDKYNNIPVFITENGCMDLVGGEGRKEEEILDDKHRIKFISGHLEAVAKGKLNLKKVSKNKKTMIFN